MVRRASCKAMSISTVAVIITIMASGCMGREVLLSGKTLNAGQYLAVGDYRFIMQENCNLVLYEGQCTVWASNTVLPDSRGCRATLLNTGNLVIYDRDGASIWSSNSAQAVSNYILVMQEDRNVVIYGSPTWATGTYITKVGGVVVTAINGTLDGGSSIGSRKTFLHNSTSLGHPAA